MSENAYLQGSVLNRGMLKTTLICVIEVYINADVDAVPFNDKKVKTTKSKFAAA